MFKVFLISYFNLSNRIQKMLYADMGKGQEAKRRMEISNRKLEVQRGKAGSPEPLRWESDHGGVGQQKGTTEAGSDK